ncbi:hypothetical protein HPP92_019246 [Vanilla planifolia]|uniref:Dof-type domain-containing protein n=1 Tax=Vanilla planifolia TaxID=51239 RepID=A0A835UKK0_VANPL|nr:hypothetical protein HPP92_019246 [Vanilla planifolia]
MAEGRDWPIKLFGRSIPMSPSTRQVPAEEVLEMFPCSREPEDQEKGSESGELQANDPIPDVLSKLEKQEIVNSPLLNKGNACMHETSASIDNLASDPKPEQTTCTATRTEKTFKRPDKVLSCPRCKSMDTKFCYYNNYNVNQPRHFCKNCERHWTAGGSMRNVPVGAGRRKSKQSPVKSLQIVVSSDGVAVTQLYTPGLQGNVAVHKLGSETQLRESKASVLNTSCTKESNERFLFTSSMPPHCEEIRYPQAAVCFPQNGICGYSNGVTSPFPVYWPWNSLSSPISTMCVYNLGTESGNYSPQQAAWIPPPLVAAPAHCSSVLPFPLMPSSFWGPWSVPYVGSNGFSSSPSSSTCNSTICSSNGSPNLGKHSRETDFMGEEKVVRSLWVPKTLRIDDPHEATKSSIWVTLGICPNDHTFQSRNESKGRSLEAAQALQA